MDSDEIKTSDQELSLLKTECGPYFIPHLVVMKVFIWKFQPSILNEIPGAQ